MMVGRFDIAADGRYQHVSRAVHAATRLLTQDTRLFLKFLFRAQVRMDSLATGFRYSPVFMAKLPSSFGAIR